MKYLFTVIAFFSLTFSQQYQVGVFSTYIPNLNNNIDSEIQDVFDSKNVFNYGIKLERSFFNNAFLIGLSYSITDRLINSIKSSIIVTTIENPSGELVYFDAGVKNTLQLLDFSIAYQKAFESY